MVELQPSKLAMRVRSPSPALTFIVDYGLISGLGHFFNGFFGDTGFLHRLSERISTPGAQTILRIPLFVAFIALLVAGSRRLRSAAPAVGLRDGARE